MEIVVTHHVDSSEPDAAGLYEWRYEYDLVHFSEAGVTHVARSDATEPEEAHFLRVERAGKASVLTQDDLAHPLFRQAVQHLQASGKKRIN